MHRHEIKAKFDEIVAFAEVERFLDTPVKRYSSGMYVRLAFAVAAHLEPEILIVDEVLAVGDAEFQKKCLGKMRQVSVGEGRTVLFVSHNLDAVRQLCTHGLLLRSGRVDQADTASAVAATYRRLFNQESGATPSQLTNELALVRLEVQPTPLKSGCDFTLHVTIKGIAAAFISSMAILIYSSSGTRVAIIDCRDETWPLRITGGQTIDLTARVKACPLIEGVYSLGLYLATGSGHYDRLDLLDLTIEPPDATRTVLSHRAEYLGYVRFSDTVTTQIS
jgi:energy-coupling factor transporter ATP-binding protein EcfA2